MPLNLELFYSPYCSRCGKTRRALRAFATAWPVERLTLREQNVLEALERAVAVGVTQTPALAIDGKLVPGPVPSVRALAALVRERLSEQAPP